VFLCVLMLCTFDFDVVTAVCQLLINGYVMLCYVNIRYPTKICNPHISVLHILCEVKFKFRCLQLNLVYYMPNGIASGSVDIYR